MWSVTSGAPACTVFASALLPDKIAKTHSLAGVRLLALTCGSPGVQP